MEWIGEISASPCGRESLIFSREKLLDLWLPGGVFVTICRGGSKYSHFYKPMISGGGRGEAFQPPLQIQYVVVVSIMLGRWLWHFLLGAGIICITIGFIPRPAYPVRVILQGRLPKIWLWWFIYNWHIWSRNVFSRDIGGDLVY